MTEKIEYSSIICSANSAMWGNITPNLRSISINLNNENKNIDIQYVFSKKPTEEELHTVSCIGTEIIADTVAPWTLHEEFITLPYPKKMSFYDIKVYIRCEESWVFDNSNL